MYGPQTLEDWIEACKNPRTCAGGPCVTAYGRQEIESLFSALRTRAPSIDRDLYFDIDPATEVYSIGTVDHLLAILEGPAA